MPAVCIVDGSLSFSPVFPPLLVSWVLSRFWQQFTVVRPGGLTVDPPTGTINVIKGEVSRCARSSSCFDCRHKRSIFDGTEKTLSAVLPEKGGLSFTRGMHNIPFHPGGRWLGWAQASKTNTMETTDKMRKGPICWQFNLAGVGGAILRLNGVVDSSTTEGRQYMSPLKNPPNLIPTLFWPDLSKIGGIHQPR